MLISPDRIGPYESADRVWSDQLWPLYLVLLFAVEFHGGVGLYRLCGEMGLVRGQGRGPRRGASGCKSAKWAITVFFLVLGLATLAAYMKIGIEHEPRYGERYVPAIESPRRHRQDGHR